MATKFSPCKGSYVLNQFPSNVMFGMNGFHVSASGAIQGHHGPLVMLAIQIYAYMGYSALKIIYTALKIIFRGLNSLPHNPYSFNNLQEGPF